MEHNQHLIDNQSFKTFKIDRSLAFIKIYTLSSILRFNLIKESSQKLDLQKGDIINILIKASDLSIYRILND